jgi:NTP pyrophosphatase (non-canonical NTP hydrolase)
MGSDEVIAKLKEFVASRDWDQFHTQENLAKSISIEAAELLEVFQWGNPSNVEAIKEELADVLTYCFLLANKLGESPEELILEKLKVTSAKYPLEKSKGSSAKYDQL